MIICNCNYTSNMQIVRMNYINIRWQWSFSKFRIPYRIMGSGACWMGKKEMEICYGKKWEKLMPKNWEYHRGTHTVGLGVTDDRHRYR